MFQGILVQLLRLLDNFLPITTTASALPPRIRISSPSTSTPTTIALILHLLIAKIRRYNTHLPLFRLPQPQLRIIQHLNRQIHALGPEIDNQRVAFESPVVVRVELDARFPGINLFGNDAAAGEDAVDFVDGRRWREGEVGHVDGGVFALARLFLLLGLLASGGGGLLGGQVLENKKGRRKKGRTGRRLAGKGLPHLLHRVRSE